VNVVNLGFYKYEYVQAGSSDWITIAAGNTPVTGSTETEEAQQHSWDTSDLISGDYQLRLVVADNENNTLPACTVSIRIIGQ
jgi:hypothetical protein